VEEARLILAAAALLLLQQPPAEKCKYCRDDPKILSAAGLVGHGPMPFGKTNSDDVKRFLSYADPLFLESAHFRIASTLEEYKIPEKDWKRMWAELNELRKLFPSIPPKLRVLDPWLRLHLYAQRCEALYTRFLDLVGNKEGDFRKTTTRPYMGEGRFLGMKDKYEVFLHKDMRAHLDLLKEHIGVSRKKPQMWHFTDRGALTVSIPAIDDLRTDEHLHANVAHDLGHNFVCGFRHYSFDPPVWIVEGFAHWFEREICDYDSFCSEEAAVADMYTGTDWKAGTLRILERGKAATLADLVHKKSFNDIGREDHVIAWSKVDFLVRGVPQGFPKLLNGIKGKTDDRNLPIGTDLIGTQRDVVRAEFGWTFAEFDAEWEKWVRKAYVPQR